jgi:putative radical SAM enzyme (TIGR03279 family)
MVRITAVAPDSIAAELGIPPGTDLVSVGGRPLHDFLDWEFLSAEDRFSFLARLPNGDMVDFDIERPEGMPMGMELEPPRIRRCGNRCDFCFVDGLPPGLRKSLYVRDDDYRLSFRHGNFATLTNLKPFDVARILEYRLSPLYVSVHATDPIVRRRLLRNPGAPAIVEQLREFAAGGIAFHTQIVLQPGVNDGAVLSQSLSDLWDLGPSVLSVSVVPVGLTEFSKHTRVREPTSDECRDAVHIVHQWGERAWRERGERWVHGSDELYVVAREELPPAEWYGEFDQVENGVGSVRYLQRQIENMVDPPDLCGMRLGVVTGTAMGALMPLVVPALSGATGAEFEIVPVVNNLFGPHVTTAGLLPGRSILHTLSDRTDLAGALFPAESLNDDDLFIDDLELSELVRQAPVPVIPSYSFVDALHDFAAI